MVGAWLAAGISIAVAPAPQQPSAFELTWDAPEACPTAADVTRKIDRYLSSSSPEPAAPIRARARILQADGGFELTLTVDDVSGARTVRSDNCEDLADATAFLVSLTVDPTLSLDEPEPEPPPEPEPEPEPEPQPEPRPKPNPEPPPQPTKRTPQLIVRVDGGAGIGGLPRIGGNIGAAIGGQFGRGRVELIGRYAVPQLTDVDEVPSAGARFMLGSATARGCGVFYAGRVEFPMCGGVELGAVRASGVGVAEARVAHRLWAGLNVGPSLHVVFGPAALTFGVEATTLLSRPTFEIGGAGAIHRLGPVHGRALIGVELRWPPTKPRPRGK